jgi:hypothetical protein
VLGLLGYGSTTSKSKNFSARGIPIATSGLGCVKSEAPRRRASLLWLPRHDTGGIEVTRDTITTNTAVISTTTLSGCLPPVRERPRGQEIGHCKAVLDRAGYLVRSGRRGQQAPGGSLQGTCYFSAIL